MNLKSLVFCFFITVFVSAQDYERVDATIQLYPERVASPEALSKFITRDFTTQEDKVRAIYSWLIKNVAYHPDEYKQFNYNFKNYRERNQKEEKTRKKIIERTLSRGVAVCEGYAMTFERLCQLQGIENYLVRGDIKTSFKDIGRPFKTTHMWNIAVINDTRYLFDATWGAGKYTNKFVKEPSYFFYKTPPELFIKTHYPVSYEDALLEQKIPKEAFLNWPIVIVPELPISAIKSPKKGIVSSQNLLGTIDFSIKMDSEVEVSYRYTTETKNVTVSYVEGMLTFSVPIELGKQNLLIFFDGKPALAYQIK